MIPKPLDHITEADLQALISDAVPEGRTIEYKRALPGNSDGEKKEFLADISSFANTSGGDLIYGMDESADSDNRRATVLAVVLLFPPSAVSKSGGSHSSDASKSHSSKSHASTTNRRCRLERHRSRASKRHQHGLRACIRPGVRRHAVD
jgi:predicted HTH transcriptional regulator